MRIRVTVPTGFVRLASEWHAGQSSMLYAVASTGGLNPGSIRPSDDDGNPMSDGEWHVMLWDDLESEIRACIRSATDDARELARLDRFLAAAERTTAELRDRYGIPA
jgi:hypothetical protein